MIDAAETARRATEIYADHIRTQVEPEKNGQFIVIDIESGDYEIDPDELAAGDRLTARHPDGRQCLLRVGYPTAHRIGYVPPKHA